MEFNIDTSRHRQEGGRERTMQSNRCVDWPAYEEEMKHKNGKGNIGQDQRYRE